MRVALVAFGLLVTIQGTVARYLWRQAEDRSAYAPDPQTGRTWEVLYRGGDTRYVTKSDMVLHDWLFGHEIWFVLGGLALIIGASLVLRALQKVSN